MMEIQRNVQEAFEFVRSKTNIEPSVAIILGTGLGELAESVGNKIIIPYHQIPHFPVSTVQGHTGSLIVGELSGCQVAAMQGRFHYYEGYSLQEVTLPIRLMRLLGAERLFINSASGVLNPIFRSGDVMVVIDHINFQGDNPLRGVTDSGLGDRFPDMSSPYDETIIKLSIEAATESNIELHRGIYAAVNGPSLETRAETRMLRLLGADAVGMSTVPEVIVAKQVGFRTLVLAAITNVNIPDSMQPISLEGVIHNAGLAGKKIGIIINYILRKLAERS
jgi:purine-nucleoside phosphorylase